VDFISRCWMILASFSPTFSPTFPPKAQVFIRHFLNVFYMRIQI
jgi:hypothetical protein